MVIDTKENGNEHKSVLRKKGDIFLLKDTHCHKAVG